MPAFPLPTFAEKFCAQRHIAPEKFEAAVLRLALHAPARVLRPFLALFPDYFSADRDFVSGVGRISQVNDFDLEAQDFAHHPSNHGVLRQGLRLRVSTRKLRRLVRSTMINGATNGSKP